MMPLLPDSLSRLQEAVRMKDKGKTKEQLIAEVEARRRPMGELEKLKDEGVRAKEVAP